MISSSFDVDHALPSSKLICKVVAFRFAVRRSILASVAMSGAAGLFCDAASAAGFAAAAVPAAPATTRRTKLFAYGSGASQMFNPHGCSALSTLNEGQLWKAVKKSRLSLRTCSGDNNGRRLQGRRGNFLEEIDKVQSKKWHVTWPGLV